MKSIHGPTTPDLMQCQASMQVTHRIPACRLTGLLLTLLLLCGITGVAQAVTAVCRVTTTGVASNSGADWAHPKDIASGMNPYLCTEAWVEQGVYFADTYPYNFTLLANAHVYGGFVGNESSRSQRDPWAHVTILSGDKDHDDINTDGNFIDETISDIRGTDNSHNVVLISPYGKPISQTTNTTVLDGFTITGGDGRQLGNSGFGAGLLCQGVGSGNECSPTLSNLVFVGNVAAFGGAVYLDGGQNGKSSPVISNVIFSHNAASNNSGQSFGGALYCSAKVSGTCSPSLTNVVFSYNDSSYYGGGMWNDAQVNGISNPTLNEVTFDHNTANYQGGGMQNYGYGGTSNPTLTNVTFSNNSSVTGGALYNLGIKDANNNAGTSSPTLSNVTFFNNSANSGGGAIYNYANNFGTTNPILTNVTFSGNHAGMWGGAIFSTGAAVNGLGIVSVALTNVILWNNSAASGANLYFDDTNYASTSLSIGFSAVEGGDSSIFYKTGTGSSAFSGGIANTSGDPVLGSLANNGGLTLTMVPSPAGSAVDDGICSGAPIIDQRGVGRPTGAGCDIGAVEFKDDTIFASGFEH